MAKLSHNRLLIIDDEPEFRTFFKDVAQSLGFETAEAGNREQFDSAYAQLDPTVVLLDLTMPDMDGVEYLRNLAKRKCTVPIILASGQDARVLSTAERLGRMFKLSMTAALQKPVSVKVLEGQLEALLQNRDADDLLPADDARIENFEITPEMIQAAIQKQEFSVLYQPKISLQDSSGYRVSGSEALSRWQHPKFGLISPDTFIPIVEQAGLISALTDQVIKKILVQQTLWTEMGHALPVAFNLSPAQLTQLDLPDKIATLMDEAGLDRSLLQVEITEEAAMADIGMATDILTRLRLKDIYVSLDDFGSGFSSLIEIYRMPINELKIDRSLVTEIDTSEDARTVIRAIVALARELKLSVCAEGIETAQTADFLSDIGCDKGQGFLFGRPMPSIDFVPNCVAGQLYNNPDVIPLKQASG